MSKCPIDCGDSGCRCASEHTGMRTNGGCRCGRGFGDEKQNTREVATAMTWWRDRAQASTEALQRLKCRVDDLIAAGDEKLERYPRDKYMQGQVTMARAVALLIYGEQCGDGKGIDDE